MSYMDRKNILSEGLIDKLINVLKKASKNAKDKKLKKAYLDAFKSIESTNKSLDASLKKAGLNPKDFEG